MTDGSHITVADPGFPRRGLRTPDWGVSQTMILQMFLDSIPGALSWILHCISLIDSTVKLNSTGGNSIVNFILSENITSNWNHIVLFSVEKVINMLLCKVILQTRNITRLKQNNYTQNKYFNHFKIMYQPIQI